MLVKAKRIISSATGEELGDASPWLKPDNVYLVLAVRIELVYGIRVCVQTENYNEPRFLNLIGFEILSQRIPPSWTMQIDERNVVNLLPKSWVYDDFWGDLEDEKPDAVELFLKEAKITRDYEEQCKKINY